MDSTSTLENATNCIRIRGARTNNLKDVSVDIPRNQLVVITGVSGSGKTSLAFDTIFAEGRRQFIEGQSVYTRQFLNQLPRADIESIDGLQPTLAIDQKTGGDNPRSTVATITEIYDYLRVLMARCGDVHCHQCNEVIGQQTVDQIRDRLMELPERTKIMVMAPVVRDRKGKHAAAFEKIRNERLVRIRVNGQIFDIEQPPELSATKSHTIEAVTDRIIIRDGIESRLVESLELAARLGDGVVSVSFLEPETPDWQDTIYSTKYACPDCQIDYAEVEPRTFSFNSPQGVCRNCTGLGVVEDFELSRVLDLNKSLVKGAVRDWEQIDSAEKVARLDALKPLLESLDHSPSLALENLSANQLKTLWLGDERYPLGIRTILEKDLATATETSRRQQLESYLSDQVCPQCQGSRLCQQANAVLLQDHSIGQITSKPIDESINFFDSITFSDYRSEVASPLVHEISHRLKYLDKVGVGYLSLNRSGRSLSGGEHQRVRLASAIGTGLTCVCFVLDEPSIGLHQRDNQKLIDAIINLRDRGNSVIVVEHDEEMMRIADCLIDVGPAAGKRGGRIVASGSPSEISETETSLTGQYLNGSIKIEPPSDRREPTEWLKLIGASGHNLKHVDLNIPFGLFTCITGVSGSGKSTLLNGTLAPELRHRLDLMAPTPAPFESIQGAEKIDRLVEVDQKPFGKSSRGCAATYTGIFDEIRKIFAKTKEAKQLGFSASRFSFNSKSGCCLECQGHGQRKIKMNFLPDLFVDCPACGGTRFNLQTLKVHFRGLNIAEILQLPIEKALVEFQNVEKIRVVLQCLVDVGLGYLSLGQPSNTFSGGEAQRIKLATELSRPTLGHTLYLMDEPTTGLHFEDIRRLLKVIFQLVEKGNSVIVIEHNLDVIKCADWIVDLGPEGGLRGGEIIAEGSPEQVAQNKRSHTGRYLQRVI